MTDLINNSDKTHFINSLNKRGFILERKVWKILNDVRYGIGIERGVKGVKIDPVDVSEIDFVFSGMNYVTIIECKRTDYTWVFTKSENQIVNTFYHHVNTGIKIKPLVYDFVTTVDSDIAIMIDDDGKLEMKNDIYAKTSYEDVYDHVIQLLKNMEVYLGLKSGNFPAKCANKLFCPILLTNAKIGLLDFNDSQIDDSGNLTDYNKLEEVPFVAYNKPFIMQFDNPEENNEFMKTVFIVNIRHLKEFVERYGDCDISWMPH